jgi:uncharacterized protein with HEPN domain
VSSRTDRERLGDMIDSAKAIIEFTEGMSFETFSQDRKTIRAVSYELIVMGEAVRTLEHITHTYSDIPWKELNAVRKLCGPRILSLELTDFIEHCYSRVT